MSSDRQNEDSILKKISARAGLPPRYRKEKGAVVLGMGDDAALFRPRPGYETILTCDWFLEGTHFWQKKHSPDAVGWKCLARAVSDIAAMGGVPRCFLLSLALPETQTGRWLVQFLGGLRRASRKFHCVLAGGDTTRRNEILINVMVVGEIRFGNAVLRSGALAGDILYVSGRLGEAELGLRLVKRSKGTARADNPLTKKHLYPEPRLALGQWLARNGLATAMMDLSDGLSSDLPRLCAASGAGARVEMSKIPLVRRAELAHRSGHDPMQLALHGGDDYELLFAIPRNKAKLLPKTYRGIALTPIGKITEKREVLVVEESGRARKLVPGGWDPFRNRS